MEDRDMQPVTLWLRESGAGPDSDTTGAAARNSRPTLLWLREQNERHARGLCIYCGVSLGECWCGEQEPVEYERLAGLDADREPE